MTKNPHFDFDLIIIGSGAAGSSAAFTASKAGLRTALVEKSHWGGNRIYSEALPFQAASSFSHLYQESQRGAKFGLSTKNLRYNYPTVLHWQKLATKRSASDIKKSFESSGITCLRGLAHFLSPYELSVGSACYTAPKFLIASGATINTQDIVGIDTVEYLTPATALNIPRVPKTMLVIGGGPTGCEFAEYFATLGTKVCIAELSSRILPQEDTEASTALAKHLEKTFGIKTLVGARVVSLAKNSKQTQATIIYGGYQKTISADAVLLATDKTPSLDLGLENTGIKTNHQQIITNDYLQTSVKHIFSAGSCTNPKNTIEQDAYEGVVSASNIIGRPKNTAKTTHFIRTVNTNPQIASVGLTEQQCKAKRLKFKSSFVPLSSISSANTSDFRTGFIKLYANGRQQIIGATVMCPHAELVIQEIAFAIQHKLTASALASTPHVSSSWSELVRLSAQNITKDHK